MVPVALSLSPPSRSVASKREGKPSGFADGVARLLDRIDCRRAETSADREAIFRLRYQAYLREGAISANPSETFSDSFDETGNVYLFGLHIGGELASSIRIHVGCKEYPHFPSLEVFADVLQPELDAGKVIVDPTRFVADERLSRLHRGLPYATLRLSMVAGEHFHADYVLAAVRAEHQAFYRRAFNQRVIREPRPYPQLAKPISLMAVHYPSVVDDLWRQYPFIPSTPAERRRLFERSPAPPEPYGALKKNQPLS
ncbi:MAG: hypothetical protein P4L80_14230 [Xanthobacteraceae bacterium]|nr:hypothetical protein [Xanthobacteraceae bacterium]